MSELQIMRVTTPEGKEEEIKIVTILRKPEDGKEIILYTYDDEADDIDIYASVLKKDSNGNLLDAITEKEDWLLVQKAIKELSE